MEVSNLNLLTQQQQIEMREWEALFNRPAWTWLMDKLKAEEEAATSFLLTSAQTEAQVHDARARIQVLSTLQAWESAMEQVFNQLTDSAQLSADEMEDSMGANS